jgi:hypothetical protein
MAAAAEIEANGIPIDVDLFARLGQRWSEIRRGLIDVVDADFGVYDGERFVQARFEAYLARRRLPWPRLASGAPRLDDDTFRECCKAHPELNPLRELRYALGQLRLNQLAIGSDGRNRAGLSAFRALTGRNAPSSARFIFGPATWLRSLIKPAEGRAIAYLDFASQEIAIAAALSGDDAMWTAYASGDPYLAFAIQAGLAPPRRRRRRTVGFASYARRSSWHSTTA